MDIETVSRSVCSALETKSFSGVTAEEMGLEDIRSGGSYAEIVGQHPDLPNVCVKVVPVYDPFVLFCRESLAGRLSSVHLPSVYSMTRVGDRVVCLVEYIPEECPDDMEGSIWCLDEKVCKGLERVHDLPQSLEDLVVTIRDYDWGVSHTKISCDLHDGNIRLREDGTIVWIDPVWCSDRSKAGDLLEYGEPSQSS